MKAAVAWKWAVGKLGLPGVLLCMLSLVIGLLLCAKLMWAMGSAQWYEWRADRATKRAETAEIRAETAEKNLAGANTDAEIASAAGASADAGTHESRTATTESEDRIHAIANRPRTVRDDAVDADILRELEVGAERIRSAKDRLRRAPQRGDDAGSADVPDTAAAGNR